MLVPRTKWKLAILCVVAALAALGSADSLKETGDRFDSDSVQDPTNKVGEGDLRISDINVLLPV